MRWKKPLKDNRGEPLPTATTILPLSIFGQEKVFPERVSEFRFDNLNAESIRQVKVILFEWLMDEESNPIIGLQHLVPVLQHVFNITSYAQALPIQSPSAYAQFHLFILRVISYLSNI